MFEQVTVRVPATTANLGAGFDCLGMALALTQEITLRIGPGEEQPGGLGRLVCDAARSAYRLAHVPVPMELTASGKTSIPIGRGLGASAAARAAGVVGANALMGGRLSEEQMLTLGANLEGHADNMAPALFGGLQIVVREEGGWQRLRAPVAEGLRIVLFIPDFDMPTNESRRLLPQQVSREDAIYNVSRAALMVAALGAGAWDALATAAGDRLHQPARAHIFPAMEQIFAAARAEGAHAAYLSGGGSTIAAFVTRNEARIGAAMQEAAAAAGFSGHVKITHPSSEGAAVIG